MDDSINIKNTETVPRVGVYVCHCGGNISNTVDIEKVVEAALKLPGVVLADHNLFQCSDPGQDQIIEDIKAGKLNKAGLLVGKVLSKIGNGASGKVIREKVISKLSGNETKGDVNNTDPSPKTRIAEETGELANETRDIGTKDIPPHAIAAPLPVRESHPPIVATGEGFLVENGNQNCFLA